MNNKIQYIGKLNKVKIGEYADIISTDEVILTDERKKHIYKDHTKDYSRIMDNIQNTVINPDEVIEDKKNKDTLFFIKKLKSDNLNVVVKLNTTNSKEHPKNSIMTAWIIRNINLKKLREKFKCIYKSE